MRGPVAVLVAGAVLLGACSPTTTTAALGDALPLGSDGWYGIGLEQPMAMPDLVLTDATGRPYDLRAETAGRPALLFFGYASCPDICPVHLSVIAQAMDQARISTEQLSVVFVSADPARDTPELMGEYLAAFDPGFVGLTGDLDAVKSAIRSLGLPEPTYGEPDERGFYLVGHPAAVVAFDDAGQARRLYPFGTRRAQWVHDLPLLLRGESR
ncbi:MAG: SCO family protein [Acidimicrobiia bacterium]